MKTAHRYFIWFLLVVGLMTLTGCSAIPYMGPGLVVGQSYRLESGETLDTDLTVIGGNASLEEGSTVNGDVAVIGGNVTVNGSVNGDLTVMGGFVFLDHHARVLGSVETLGGTVQRSSGAVVEGTVLPDRPGRITTIRNPTFNVSFEPITSMLMAIFQALALAALAVLINLFAPRPMERTGQSAAAAAAASGGVGCLTLLVLVIMAITIILLPVSLLGMLAAGVAILFGWTALGLLVGRRLATLLNQTWTDPINAGAGTLALSLLTSLLNIIPCIGWLASFVVVLVALGAVVLTRFGTQAYPVEARYAPAPVPYTPAAVPPVVPPAAPPQQTGATGYPSTDDAPRPDADSDPRI
jgi:hypothetical protein